MKKSIIATSLVALLAPLAIQTAVLADNTTTNASVTINAGILPNNPVDPKDKDDWSNGTKDPNDPKDPSFRLMQVPSNFKFNDTDVKSSDQDTDVQAFNYIDVHRKDKKPIYDGQVQVGDLSGKGAGWTLSAKLSDLSVTDKTKKLTSATVAGDTSAKIRFSDLDNQEDNVIHGLYNTVGNGSGNKVSTKWTKQVVDLVANGDTTEIITPGAKQGMGITTLRFDKDNVKLTVPAAQQLLGTYMGSITWTLGAPTPDGIKNSGSLK